MKKIYLVSMGNHADYSILAVKKSNWTHRSNGGKTVAIREAS